MLSNGNLKVDMNTIRLRMPRLQDLPAMLPLAKQLGYEADIEVFKNRYELLASSSDHQIVVAEMDDGPDSQIVGMALFRKHVSLLTPPQLEVSGVVVDEQVRGQGVGKILLLEAERVCRVWGLKKIRLTSNVKRTDAHRFYLNLGYAQPKTSHLFEKVVD
jgi:GNAT superfamily N-acetyltransferase